MVGGGICRYVGIDVSLGRVMAERRSLRRLFTIFFIGILLTDCLVSCVLHFSYCVFRFV